MVVVVIRFAGAFGTLTGWVASGDTALYEACCTG